MFKRKIFNNPSSYQERASHYISYLRVPNEIYQRRILNKTNLGIYEFSPSVERQFWTYLTSGMSEISQGSDSKKEIYTELLFYSIEKSEWIINLLTSLASYPFEYNEPLISGDTLPLGNPISSTSKLTGLFMLSPLLENPNFCSMDISKKKTEILWAFPITESELKFIISGFDLTKFISHNQIATLLDLERNALIDS